jgi:hypothetical protein
MEISPISVVRIAPMIRSKETDLGLTDVFEIERSSRSDDETYSPGGNKAASGFEDDENTAGNEQETDSEAEAKPKAEESQDGATGQISIFA